MVTEKIATTSLVGLSRNRCGNIDETTSSSPFSHDLNVVTERPSNWHIMHFSQSAWAPRPTSNKYRSTATSPISIYFDELLRVTVSEVVEPTIWSSWAKEKKTMDRSLHYATILIYGRGSVHGCTVGRHRPKHEAGCHYRQICLWFWRVVGVFTVA